MFVEKWKALLSIQDHHAEINGNVDEEGVKAFVQRYVLPYAPPDKYPRFLDLGCGPGIELKVLRDLGYNPVGITLGSKNIEYSRDHYGITPVYGDMHDLPSPPESFDVVLTRQVFEHSFAPWLLTLEIWVVLRSKGRWIVDLPSPRNKDMWAIWHASLFYPNQMRFLFEKCGFRIVFEDIGNTPWSLDYNGGGEPYTYVVERKEDRPDDFQQVIEKLREIHARP